MGRSRIARKPKPAPAPKKRKWAMVAAGAALALAVLGLVVHRAGSRPRSDLARLSLSGAATGYNLLLVTLDTVRCDHLGSYGYALAHTPTFDSLAEQGVQFDQAVTPTPLTLPAHATMLTGLSPPRHGVRGNGNFRLTPEHVTLAQTLKARGYDTAAFIACFILDERFGLSSGFDTYDFQVTPDGFDRANLDFNQRPASAVSDAAIQWLRARRAAGVSNAFFAWVHYFDAHRPYRSPLAAEPRFAGRPYDAEIAYVDGQFQRVLDELDHQGLRQRTLIAVVSDHGEGLDEHDEPTHGLLLYDSTVRVAFILSHPRLFGGPVRVSDRLVCLEDLRPTLEDLLGVPRTPDVDGISLVSARPEPDRAVYIETLVPLTAAQCSPLYGLRRVADKYIRAPEPEYYDLRADPGELKNLYDPGEGPLATLDTRLSEVMSRLGAADSQGSRRAVSKEELDRLGSLGYVHAEPTSEPAVLPDPKAMLRANRMVSAALRMLKGGQKEQALQLAQQAVRECPAMVDASDALAMIFQEMNRPEEALAALRACFQINPKVRTALQIARAQFALGRFDQMVEPLHYAEKEEPDNGMIYLLRGDSCLQQGQIDEAIVQYELALRVDEHRVGNLVRPQLDRLRESRRSP